MYYTNPQPFNARINACKKWPWKPITWLIVTKLNRTITKNYSP